MALLAFLAFQLATALAQQPGSSDGRPPSSADRNVDPLISDLESYVGPGDSMFIVMGSPIDAPPPPPPPGFSPPNGKRPVVCDGLPAVMTRASTSNGACFGPNVTTALSCSCIKDLAGLDTWDVRVTSTASNMSNELPPPTLPATTVFSINQILIFTLPSTLGSFSLTAETTKPLRLQFRLMPGPPGAGSSIPSLVRVPFVNALKSLDITNIDLGGLQLQTGFLPTGVSNLSLRKCNLTRLPSDFLNKFIDLQSLDVSINSLKGIYQDVTSPSLAPCPLTSLNLSGNAFTELPSDLLNFKLTSLDLSGNPITNATVTTSAADTLSSLATFRLSSDATNTSCSEGVWRQIQDSRVCVLQSSVSQQGVSQDTGDGGHGFVIYVVIGCIVVIVLLLLVIVRKRLPWGRKSVGNKDALESLFDSTIPFDDSHPTVSASLLNDPIIITNRIPYNDLRLANCISKGGFGLVYSGVYNRRRVAIKKIRPERAGDIKMIEAFLKEICLMATLSHPCIVEFVGVSWDTLRNLCAVTEFMERGDLREVLQAFKLRNTPLTWTDHKAAIAVNVAEALTYLHSLSPKVIHRDLKSKNVLLNGEMEAKLSDFGISRERHLEETHMTAGIGTSFWIAPEVLLGKDYDERADIFSFGVVLSEIDTDDYPYWNEKNPNVGGHVQQNKILQMVASGALRPSFSESCPKAVLELADLCLQVDPDDRPTAAEIVYELQRFVATLPPVRSDFYSTSSGV